MRISVIVFLTLFFARCEAIQETVEKSQNDPCFFEEKKGFVNVGIEPDMSELLGVYVPSDSSLVEFE